MFFTAHINYKYFKISCIVLEKSDFNNFRNDVAMLVYISTTHMFGIHAGQNVDTTQSFPIKMKYTTQKS